MRQIAYFFAVVKVKGLASLSCQKNAKKNSKKCQKTMSKWPSTRFFSYLFVRAQAYTPCSSTPTFFAFFTANCLYFPFLAKKSQVSLLTSQQIDQRTIKWIYPRSVPLIQKIIMPKIVNLWQIQSSFQKYFTFKHFIILFHFYCSFF